MSVCLLERNSGCRGGNCFDRGCIYQTQCLFACETSGLPASPSVYLSSLCVGLSVYLSLCIHVLLFLSACFFVFLLFRRSVSAHLSVKLLVCLCAFRLSILSTSCIYTPIHIFTILFINSCWHKLLLLLVYPEMNPRGSPHFWKTILHNLEKKTFA